MSWPMFLVGAALLIFVIAIVIPFGFCVAYGGKWKIWYKWVNHVQKEEKEKQLNEQSHKKSHVHETLNNEQKPQ